MNTIDAVFKNSRTITVMPFVEAGLPSPTATTEIILACEDAGASIIELGVPFSDPIADGPTIQAASFKSLKKGTTLHTCLDIITSVRRASTIPIILFTYYNPILRMGLERFCQQAAATGANGLLVPDLSLEESEPIRQAAEKYGLYLIYLIAPTSTDDRIAAIAAQAKGFLYVVSVKGVTGARTTLQNNVGTLIKRIRRHTDLPLCIGFGISEKKHIRKLARSAQGAIVGSALVNVIMNSSRKDLSRNVYTFIKGLCI